MMILSILQSIAKVLLMKNYNQRYKRTILTEINKHTIASRCKVISKTAGGYRWEYV